MHGGILCGREKEWNLAFRDSTDGPRGHRAGWKKPKGERQILHDFTCARDRTEIQINEQMEHAGSRTRRTRRWPPGGGGGVGMTSGGCISEPDAHRERRAARPGRRAPALTAGPLPARAGARKAAGGGSEKKGRLRAEWRLRSRCPSPFQEDRSDSRFHECALLRLHVPKTFPHTEPSDSPIGACSGVDGLRAQTLELARLESSSSSAARLARPSPPFKPYVPSSICEMPMPPGRRGNRGTAGGAQSRSREPHPRACTRSLNVSGRRDFSQGRSRPLNLHLVEDVLK